MTAEERARSRWAKAPVRQPASRGPELWRLDDDERSVWIRAEHNPNLSWQWFAFPVPPATGGPRHPLDTFNPGCLTAAFDSLGMDGPWVDLAVGAAEPDVDSWEDGLAVPTLEQVRRVAFLTGFVVPFFYRPESMLLPEETTLRFHWPAEPKRRPKRKPDGPPPPTLF